MNFANYHAIYDGKDCWIRIQLAPGIRQALYASNEDAMRLGMEKAVTQACKRLHAQPDQLIVRFVGCDF